VQYQASGLLTFITTPATSSRSAFAEIHRARSDECMETLAGRLLLERRMFTMSRSDDLTYDIPSHYTFDEALRPHGEPVQAVECNRA